MALQMTVPLDKISMSCDKSVDLLDSSMDDSAKRGLTQFWELFTIIPWATKYLKR